VHYDLRALDISDAAAPDSFNHSKFVDLLPSLREIAGADYGREGNPIFRAGTFVVEAGRTILQPQPMRLGQADLGH
jgi:hypothetical protein